MSQIRSEPANSIYNANPDYGSTNVLISPPTPLRYSGQTNTDQNYRVVYVPATREQIVIQQTYALGIEQPLNMNNRIAVRGPDGRWQPTSHAQSMGGQSLIDAINRNGTTSANFNTTTDYTIRQYNREVNGKDLTPAQRTAQLTPSGNISNSIISSTNAGQSPSATPTTTLPPAAPTPPEATPPGAAATPPGAAPRDPQSTDLISNVRDTEAAFTNVSTTLNVVSELATVKAIGLKPSKETLTYPLEFPDNMDCVKFSAKRYGTKTFSGLRVTGNTNDPSNRSRLNEETKDSVILPIQTGISDANTVGWNEETFNPAQIAGAQLAIGGITGGGEGFVNSLRDILNGMKSANTDMEKAIIAYFTEQAVGVQILPKIGGAVFNPNTELLFQGPQLRSFNFSFRLTPREEKESLAVKKIIRFFKANMAAQTTQSELFLKAPNVFGIEFFHGGSTNPHSGIGLIRDCALQACNVDYTPDGSYMSFFDGGMVSYTINLQFMELEPIYADDYNKSSHPIGY